MRSIKQNINILIASVTTLLLVLAGAGNAIAKTINAADCSRNSVASAISTASSGDTILIPAGSCTGANRWTSPITISKQNLTIEGAGSSLTTIQANNTSYSSSDAPIFSTSGSSANGLRVTGIHFLYGTKTFNFTGTGGTSITRDFRIDHCKFTGNYMALFTYSGAARGVVDNCEFIDSYGAVIFGDNSASAKFPMTLGDENAVFFEDNTITDNGGTPHFIASRLGSRYVIRHNDFHWFSYDPIDAHDDYEGPTSRGSFTWEVYNNKFYTNTNTPDRLIHMRGGQGVIWGNYVQYNAAFFIYLTSYMICWGQCSYGESSCNDMINHTYVWGNKRNCGSNMESCPSGTAWVTTDDCWETERDPLVVGRDYYNTQMPGYTPYTYPHPLRNSAVSTPQPPKNVKIGPQ